MSSKAFVDAAGLMRMTTDQLLLRKGPVVDHTSGLGLSLVLDECKRPVVSVPLLFLLRITHLRHIHPSRSSSSSCSSSSLKNV